MTISVTEFKARCLNVIRQVERSKKPIDIVRHGKVVARLQPAMASSKNQSHPWERLRGHGKLTTPPEKSVLKDSDFDALK